MKVIKYKSIIIIGVLIILISILLWFGLNIYIKNLFNHLKGDEASKYIILSSIGQLVYVLLTFLNLIFILIFFINERNYKRAERITLSKVHWFTDLIYERNIKTVEVFFDQGIEIIKNIKNISQDTTVEQYQNSIKVQFAKLSEIIIGLSIDFVELVEIIDDGLADNLNDLLEEYQDSLTTTLERIADDDVYKKSNDIVHQYKKNFIKALYDYNIQLYN